MANASDYLENKLLDHVFLVAAYTQPSNIYLAVFTSSGGLENNTEGSQTEVSGNNYSRVDVSSSFGAAASGTLVNDVNIEFPAATGTWGTITHVALMDASTSGNVLIWAELDASRTILTGDVLRIPASSWSASLD